jgi:hypothetical protein
MDPFVWIPGSGIDQRALARLRSRFKRPKEPMGEAWFMGEERRLYDELKGDLSALSVRELQEPLHEIASGTSSFGPLAEWRDWYHYLLGQLVPRAHDSSVSSLLESLITGFIALHPNGVHSRTYPQFLGDSLMTLGQSMMASTCWSENDIVVGTCLHRSNRNPNQIWRWWDASGDFSASMFFCLKYLPYSLVPAWFQSVLDIPSPHWRAQVLVWLVGSHEMLTSRTCWPSSFSLEPRPSVAWEWSHCLSSELATADETGAAAMPSLLPESSCKLALQVVRSHFTESVFIDWLLSIASVPYLEAELAELPSTFESMYVGRT